LVETSSSEKTYLNLFIEKDNGDAGKNLILPPYLVSIFAILFPFNISQAKRLQNK